MQLEISLFPITLVGADGLPGCIPLGDDRPLLAMTSSVEVVEAPTVESVKHYNSTALVVHLQSYLKVSCKTILK